MGRVRSYGVSTFVVTTLGHPQRMAMTMKPFVLVGMIVAIGGSGLVGCKGAGGMVMGYGGREKREEREGGEREREERER